MGTYRFAQLVLAIGVVLAGLGGPFLFWAFVPAQVNEPFRIPEGQGFHVYYTIWILGQGLIHGRFVTQGLEVYLRVFTADEYARYRDTGGGSYLYAILATEAQFSVSLPVTGSYYVVLSHHPDFIAEQTGTISMTVSGIHPFQLALGIGLVASAAVVILLRRRTMKRPHSMQPGAPPSVDGGPQTIAPPPRDR